MEKKIPFKEIFETQEGWVTSFGFCIRRIGQFYTHCGIFHTFFSILNTFLGNKQAIFKQPKTATNKSRYNFYLLTLCLIDILVPMLLCYYRNDDNLITAGLGVDGDRWQHKRIIRRMREGRGNCLRPH